MGRSAARSRRRWRAARFNAITSLHNFGRFEEALALSAEAIELHDRAGLDYHGKMCMHANAADALCALGRPRDAAALLGEAEGTFTSDTLLVHLGHAQVALLEGRLEAAAARLERILEVRDVEAMLILPAVRLAAEVALWRGDFATALNVLGDGEAAVCEASMAMELLGNTYMNGEVVRLDGAVRLPPR